MYVLYILGRHCVAEQVSLIGSGANPNLDSLAWHKGDVGTAAGSSIVEGSSFDRVFFVLATRNLVHSGRRIAIQQDRNAERCAQGKGSKTYAA